VALLEAAGGQVVVEPLLSCIPAMVEYYESEIGASSGGLDTEESDIDTEDWNTASAADSTVLPSPSQDAAALAISGQGSGPIRRPIRSHYLSGDSGKTPCKAGRILIFQRCGPMAFRYGLGLLSYLETIT